MDCERFEASVLDLLYGELGAASRAEAEAHAAGCESCGKLSRELGEARKVAASLPPRIAPPRELDERIALAARAAADRIDVRRHPLRGGALHVAAAVILLATLAASSFALGSRFGKPPIVRVYPADSPDDKPIRVDEPRPSGDPNLVRVTATPAPDEHDVPPPRDARLRYDQKLLELAESKLASKHPDEAIIIFDALLANANPGVTWALDARLGRAEAAFALGKLADARADAEAVHEAIARDHPAPRERRFDELDDHAARILDQISKLR